jgi:hypothetical protein
MICCSGVEGFARRFLGGPLYPRRDGVYSQDKLAVTHRPQTGVLPSHFRCFCRQLKHASKDGPGTFGSPLRSGAREGSRSLMMMLTVSRQRNGVSRKINGNGIAAKYGTDDPIRSSITASFHRRQRGEKCVKTTCNGRNQSRWIAWLEAIHLPTQLKITSVFKRARHQPRAAMNTGRRNVKDKTHKRKFGDKNPQRCGGSLGGVVER